MAKPRTGLKRTVSAAGLPEALRAVRDAHPDERFVFVCIGTDRSTGDAFGPLTGTYLLEHGLPHPVIGTLEQPCDANTLPMLMPTLPQGAVVIGIDASVGTAGAVGSFTVAKAPVAPGRSLGKALPGIGDYSVTGIVAENRANPYAVLQTARLYAVMAMAGQLAAAIRQVFASDERG